MTGLVKMDFVQGLFYGFPVQQHPLCGFLVQENPYLHIALYAARNPSIELLGCGGDQFEVDPLRCTEESILGILCESSESHVLELRIVDSGVQTILAWNLDIRTWSDPPTLSDQLLDVISGPLGFTIIGCIVLILAVSVASAWIVTRRRAVLKEALDAYGFSEQHIHEVSTPQNIPRAPDFDRD